MDTERLWLEARGGFGHAPPQDDTRLVPLLEDEMEAARESGEKAAEAQGEDEDEQDEEEEKASDTLVYEL